MSFHVMTDEQVILLGKTIASEVLKGSGQSSPVNAAEVMSVSEAAAKYKVNEKTIRNWCKEGRLKCLIAGRKYFIYKNQ